MPDSLGPNIGPDFSGDPPLDQLESRFLSLQQSLGELQSSIQGSVIDFVSPTISNVHRLQTSIGVNVQGAGNDVISATESVRQSIVQHLAGCIDCTIEQNAAFIAEAKAAGNWAEVATDNPPEYNLLPPRFVMPDGSIVDASDLESDESYQGQSAVESGIASESSPGLQSKSDSSGPCQPGVSFPFGDTQTTVGQPTVVQGQTTCPQCNCVIQISPNALQPQVGGPQIQQQSPIIQLLSSAVDPQSQVDTAKFTDPSTGDEIVISSVDDPREIGVTPENLAEFTRNGEVFQIVTLKDGRSFVVSKSDVAILPLAIERGLQPERITDAERAALIELLAERIKAAEPPSPGTGLDLESGKLFSGSLGDVTVNQLLCSIDSYTLPESIAKLAESIGSDKLKKALTDGLGKIPFAGIIVDYFLGVNAEIAAGRGCQEPIALAGLSIARGFLELLSLAFGEPMKEATIPLAYMSHRLCPTLFPTTDQATESWLANAIDDQTLKSWVEINNNCFEPWKRVIESRRSRLNPTELVLLRRREIISPSEYAEDMRRNAFIRQGDDEKIFRLSEFVPPIQDVIRFMVRDVEDVNVVEQFKLDTDFDQKWTGKSKQFGNWQGIDDETAKRYWRSHWIIPGPQQLFEMLHRLPVIGGFGDEKQVEADIRKALQIQDILPFWIDRLMTISFRPLTRIDVRRAFNIGALDKQAVEDNYRELGYAPPTAKILADFTEKLRNRSMINELPVKLWRAGNIDRQEAEQKLLADGFPQDAVDETLDTAAKLQSNSEPVKLFSRFKITRQEATERLESHGIPAELYNRWLDDAALEFDDHPAVKQYQSGEINELDARIAMAESGILIGKSDALIAEANKALDAKFASKCANFVVDRFHLGEFTADELRQELLGMRIMPQIVDRLVGLAECERKARGKHPSISQLCQWLELGQLSQDDFITRLTNLGWNVVDAVNILRACVAKLTVKEQREAAKLAKQREQEDAKRQREQKQSSGQESRRIEKARRSLEVARRAELRREKSVAQTASKLAKAGKVDLPVAFDLITQTLAGLRKEFFLTKDAAIQVVALSVTDLAEPALDSFFARSFEIGKEHADLTDEDLVRIAADSSNTNGSTRPSV